MLIDTHCHLTFPDFKNSQEVQDVIHRAQEVGIGQLLTVGVNLDDSLEALKLALAYDFVFSTMGVHPNEADKWNAKVGATFLKEIKKGWDSGVKNVVAIGEIGLDYYRKRTSREDQQEAFRLQLQFAKKVQLPVIVHCREAFEDAMRILSEESMESVVFHCFSGDLKTARRIWANDWHTSFTAMVTYSGQEDLCEVVADCPEELYFLETDSPFLPPDGHRGERNEPANVVKLAEAVAELRGQPMDQVMWQTTKNAQTFFGLPVVEE